MLIKLVILFRGGFYLKIQPYRTTRANKGANFAPGIVEGFNRIYVGNLSWDITDDGLRKFFSDCKISSIRFGNRGVPWLWSC
jgi:nucleolin